MRTLHNLVIRNLRVSLLAACTAPLLAGCMIDETLVTDSYKPTTVAERYPINVKKVPVKTGVAAPSGQLKPDQINGVIAFANDAKTMGLSKVSVKYPSGSAGSREAARQIVDILADQGIPDGMIQAASYPGGASQPIQLSYVRKVAVTKECGNWSENLGNDNDNVHYKNFGCAYQHNIAAMVANPEDFERPRSSAPVLAANRTVVMSVYYANKTAGDYFTLNEVSSSGSSGSSN